MTSPETWPIAVPPPKAMAVLKRNAPFSPEMTPADQAWIDAAFAEEQAAYTAMATEFYLRQVARLNGSLWLFDLPPADRKHIFAAYPPVLVDGSTPPWQGPGTPDWLTISGELPELYDRVLADYRGLVIETVTEAVSAVA